MRIFVSGLTYVETTLGVRGFPVTYYPVDYPFFGISSAVSGSAYRLARGLAALGDEVNLCALLGDDIAAKRILKEVEENGIRTDHIYKKLKNTVEAVSLQESAFGRRQTYCDLKDIQETYIDVASVKAAIADADVCALSNVNYNRALIIAAHEQGKTVATDLQTLYDINDAFNDEFIRSADILFVSEESISISPRDFMDVIAQRSNAKIIVIGMGKDGVIVHEKQDNSTYSINGIDVGEVLTVGAGSALFAGFLHYYGKYDCKEALKRAQVTAALRLIGNTNGNSYPTESEVEEKLAQVAFNVDYN